MCQIVVLFVSAGARVSLELDQERRRTIGAAEQVVDLEGLRTVRVLDRQLRDRCVGKLDVQLAFDDLAQVEGKKDVGAALELVRGEVAPGIQAIEQLRDVRLAFWVKTGHDIDRR